MDEITTVLSEQPASYAGSDTIPNPASGRDPGSRQNVHTVSSVPFLPTWRGSGSRRRQPLVQAALQSYSSTTGAGKAAGAVPGRTPIIVANSRFRANGAICGCKA